MLNLIFIFAIMSICMTAIWILIGEPDELY